MTLKVFLTDKYKEVNDTRIFDTLKARITVPQAAAYYGVRIGQNGMCRCPFHSDKTPSMKINESYYSICLPSMQRASWHWISASTPTRRYPLPLRFPVSGRRNPSGNGKGAAPPC